MPPLRDRGDDILLLAKYFLDLFADQNDLGSRTISEDARQKLLAYSWPGNVRELKSVIELSAVLASGEEIKASDITLGRNDDVLTDLLTEELTLRAFNYKIVKFYLDRMDNDTAQVADKLDISQSTIYRLLKEFEK